MEPRKAAIMQALDRFVAQRPGLEFGNYGDVKAYRSEARAIARDARDYFALACAVERSDSITSEDILRASWHAFSGRLTITYSPQYVSGKVAIIPGHLVGYTAKIDYVTGQYFPTEYRKAACAVLASALWDHVRASCMPAPLGYRVESWARLGKGRTRHETHPTRARAEAQLATLGGSDYGSVCDVYPGGKSPGDWLRAYFRREFGRSIANRWFS